jgi:hypothetical protein
LGKWIGCKDDGVNPLQYWGIKPIWILRLGTIFRKQPINLMLRVEGWDWKFRVENINLVQCWWIISHAQVFLMVYREHNQVELNTILCSHTKVNDVRLFMVWTIPNFYFSNRWGVGVFWRIIRFLYAVRNMLLT